MEYRNIKHLLKTCLNLKAAWSRYIFKVDTTKSGSYCSYSPDNLFSVLSIKTDWNGIDSTELFEKNSFTFHNRHCCVRTYVAESENGTAIRYDSNCIGLDSVLICSFLVFCYHLTRFGNAGSICKCKILS